MNDCSSSKLNPDAAEFKPSGLLERDLAVKKVCKFVIEALESTDKEYENKINKVLQCCSSGALPDSPFVVGQCIMTSSVSKTGNAALGLKLIKALQTSLSLEAYALLENGVFDTVHNLIRSRISGNHLMKMAVMKPQNSLDSGDASTDGTPVLMIELLHITVLLITDLSYPQCSTEVCVPPGLLAMDLCLLAEHAFTVQIDLKNDGESSDSPEVLRRVRAWHCVLEAILTSLSQSFYYFIIILQGSNEPVPPYTWNTLPLQSDRLLQGDIFHSCDVFSPGVFAHLIDRVMFRIRIMLINVILPSSWLRSIALDTLLLFVSSAWPGVSCDEWAEAPSASDGDDISIDGLNVSDEQYVIDAFRSFLESSGQVSQTHD